MGSITSLLFLFYGLVTIAAAAAKIVQGQMEGDEIKQLIMGGIFLVVGVVLFVKAKRAQRKAAEEA
jgi:predicted membrane channel-forming protein YqfA (hemolysin III family)